MMYALEVLGTAVFGEDVQSAAACRNLDQLRERIDPELLWTEAPPR